MATHTPWGRSQENVRYGRGIMYYSTARHGGFHVSPKLNETLPNHLRLTTGWYEEDCDWARVVLSFPDRFDAAMVESAERVTKAWAPVAWADYLRMRGLHSQGHSIHSGIGRSTPSS